MHRDWRRGLYSHSLIEAYSLFLIVFRCFNMFQLICSLAFLTFTGFVNILIKDEKVGAKKKKKKLCSKLLFIFGIGAQVPFLQKWG